VQIVGSVVEPFICSSLARGIRRAYLESLDRHWAIFKAREKSDALRNPYLHLRTHKAYMREIERIRSRLMPRFLSISDMRVSAGRKEAWFMLTLARLPAATGAGSARVSAEVMTYPLSRIWRRQLPIEFTGHAIDRLIQRAHVVELPLTDSDLDSIHAGFASALIWAVAALKAIEGMDAEDVGRLEVIIPAEHGIFLGRFDPEAAHLALTTFVDSAKLWEEEIYALNQLNAVGEERLALSALDLLADGWMAHDDTHVSERLIDIWKTFGWVIREREDKRVTIRPWNPGRIA
jgi:hypothetical protein